MFVFVFAIMKHGVALPDISQRFFGGSRNTAWRFLRSSKNVFFWLRGGKSAGWKRSGAMQRWIDNVRSLSEQCVLRSDQTRILEYRLETSLVTRIGANTTPINNKKERE